MLVPNRSHPSRTPKRLFAVAAVAVIALAACGDDDDNATATAPPAAAATTAPAAAATAAPATTAAGAYDRGNATATTAAAAAGAAGAVMVADSSLGKILTDANGMTLYLFMPDNAGAPTCTDACAQSWPPLTVDSGATPTGGDGVDASMLGTATHPAAGTQVTYNGWPLYHFKGDSKAGDTNGQGQGGIWYAVSPAGEAIDND
jgi:predicted lipoprotein with Yx(FWY)xxD motif